MFKLEQESYAGKEKKVNTLTKQSGEQLLTMYLPYASLPSMCEACVGTGYFTGRACTNTIKTSVYQMPTQDSKIKQSSYFADYH